MVQRGRDPRLGAESLHELRVVGQLWPQDLHGHGAAEPPVVGDPDLAHAADGDAPREAVPAGQLHAWGDHHGPPASAAAITERPIGAATREPVASRPWSPPFSTSTATATCGSSAGANATYQACGGVFFGSAPCSAVPVLEAMTRSEMLPAPGVSRSELDHHLLERVRHGDRDRLAHRLGRVLGQHGQVGFAWSSR